MTEIYLIRHAQAEGNLYKMLMGQWDGDIAIKGLEQSEALGRRMSGTHLDVIYSSDLHRAYTTALAINKNGSVPIIRVEELREISTGRWTGDYYGNFTYEYPESAKLFAAFSGKWKMDGAETFWDVQDRAWSFMNRVAVENEGKSIAVVTHRIFVRCFLTKVCNVPFEDMETVPFYDNTGITRLTFEDGKFTIDYMNDHAHIDHIVTPSWLKTHNLRDAAFTEEDGDYYATCCRDTEVNFADSSEGGFPAGSAVQREREHPGSVRRLFDGDKSAGLIDLDTQRGSEEGIGWINFFYLDEAFRGNGYGIQVLGRAVLTYLSLGRTRLRLSVDEKNAMALKFLRRYGFESIEAGDGRFLMERHIAMHINYSLYYGKSTEEG